ncbi:MAG: transaldolase [Phycisphaerae bacterium]
MTGKRVRQICEHGQAIWLDYIHRDLLRSGELRELIREGLTGMTSNPTIFQKAIASGADYDGQIRELAREGLDANAIYETLAVQDIGDAADQLRNVYNETQARDGFVSIEVSPALAHDAQATVAEARRLFARLNRPNVMIKVPATEAGLPAIRTLIGEGINVNATLIFSVAMYERVAQAYLDGLRQLQADGRPLRFVSGVASFFVSRVDTLVDKLLNERIAAGEHRLEPLRGHAAVANARIAYQRFREIFEGERFATLRAAGAHVQRPLWASTSTKNPEYPDTKYVDALIGPNTVNTLPPETLAAARDHAHVARTIDLDVEDSFTMIERLQSAGIDMKAVTDQLLVEGVQAFAASFEKLLAETEAKRARYAR